MLKVIVGFLAGRWMQETGQKIEDLEKWAAQGGWRMEQGMPRELETLLKMREFCKNGGWDSPDTYWENPPLTQEDVDSPYLPMYMLATRDIYIRRMNRGLLLADVVAYRWTKKQQLRQLIRFVAVMVVTVRMGFKPYSNYSLQGMFSGLKGVTRLMKYHHEGYGELPEECWKYHPVLLAAYYTHEIWKYAPTLSKMKDLACAIGVGLDFRQEQYTESDEDPLDIYNYLPWTERKRYVSEQGDTFKLLMTSLGSTHWVLLKPAWAVLDGSIKMPSRYDLQCYYAMFGEWEKTVEQVKECIRQYVCQSMESDWYKQGEGQEMYGEAFEEMNLDMKVEKVDFTRESLYCTVYSMGSFVIHFRDNVFTILDAPWREDMNIYGQRPYMIWPV